MDGDFNGPATSIYVSNARDQLTVERLEAKREKFGFLSEDDQAELNTTRAKWHEYDKKITAQRAIDRAREAAREAEQKPLVEVVHEINALHGRERDARLQKAFLLNHAFHRICGVLASLGRGNDAAEFKEWVDANVALSWKEVTRLIKIAKATDPIAAMTEHKKKGTDRKRKHDEKERALRNDPDALIQALKKAVKQQSDPDPEKCYNRAEDVLAALQWRPEAVVAQRWRITDQQVVERLRITETDPVQACRYHLRLRSRAQRAEIVRRFINEFEITEVELATPMPVQIEMEVGAEVDPAPEEPIPF
jgi:hypothetical protein